MVRVLVLYPRGDGDFFDYNYYLENHIRLVKERLNPVRVEVDRGLSSASGSPSPFHVVTHMIFRSQNELTEKYRLYGKELSADKERFTDIKIITQIGEILE